MSSTRQSADEHLLRSQGYAQELHRGLSLWSSFSVGFATVSPVVGIYSVMSLGAMSVGPSWVWIVPLWLARDHLGRGTSTFFIPKKSNFTVFYFLLTLLC